MPQHLFLVVLFGLFLCSQQTSLKVSFSKKVELLSLISPLKIQLSINPDGSYNLSDSSGVLLNSGPTELHTNGEWYFNYYFNCVETHINISKVFFT